MSPKTASEYGNSDYTLFQKGNDSLTRVKAQCTKTETNVMPIVSLQLPLHGSTLSGSIHDNKFAQRLKYKYK